MKLNSLASLILLILLSLNPLVGRADSEVTEVSGAPQWAGSAALASRYVSRGLDVTDGVLSPQVGVEYRFSSGWYANTFVAKMHYFGMNVEADTTVGLRGVTGALQYDVGLYYYAYPGAATALHSNFAEAGGRLTWVQGPVHPLLELYVSNNYFFGAGAGLFANAGADIVLPGQFVINTRVGFVTVKDNVAIIYPDYKTWSLGATRSVGSWDLSAQLTDTSMHRRQCINEDRCSLKLTLRIARNF